MDDTTAPLTLYGRVELNSDLVLGASGRRLPAGEEISDEFALNRLYDMSLPGEYKIVLSCKMPRRDGKGGVTVTSNSLKVTIAEH